MPFLVEKELGDICLKIGIWEKDIRLFSIEELENYRTRISQKIVEISGSYQTKNSESFSKLSDEELVKKSEESLRLMIKLAIDIYQDEKC